MSRKGSRGRGRRHRLNDNTVMIITSTLICTGCLIYAKHFAGTSSPNPQLLLWGRFYYESHLQRRDLRFREYSVIFKEVQEARLEDWPLGIKALALLLTLFCLYSNWSLLPHQGPAHCSLWWLPVWLLPAIFSVGSQRVKYFQCCVPITQLYPQGESNQRQYVTECMWLCSHKT